jgi:outer membrane receptor protein involved in Fe transport
VLFQPIESIVLGSSGGYILSPRNGRDGRVKGVELEGRLSVARIWDAAGRVIPFLPDAGTGLTKFGLNVNYSRVESSVRVQNRLDGAGHPVFREGPLQGQSTYSLNAGLYYGTDVMDGSLQLSAFGQRLAQVGAGASQTSLPDIYEYPPITLDMTLSRQISPSVRFKISAENLLDRAVEYRQLDSVTRRYRTGRTLALAMRLRG